MWNCGVCVRTTDRVINHSVSGADHVWVFCGWRTHVLLMSMGRSHACAGFSGDPSELLCT